MLRDLSPLLALLPIGAFAQTTTPNTGLYYKLAPDALAQDGVSKGFVDPPLCPAKRTQAPSIRTGFMCPRSTTQPLPRV